MKKIYTLIFFLFISLGLSQKMFASHAAGGELVYELVPNTTNQYKFTFKFYRDCSGVSEPSSFTMCYNNSCGVNNQSITLNKLVGLLPNGKPNGSPILTTGCYNAATICEGGNLPGYREWWYTGTVTLNTTCNFWRFWVSLCCRNNAIGNIVTPGSQNIFVEATFDNTIHNLNSSPFIASPPIAYFCANTPSIAYYTAIDPNGDSLTYESINPRHATGGCNNVNPINIFSAPYTFNNPFPTGNTFNVNPVSGIITFTPTVQGAWVFTVKVNEYRNGQYIGFIMRDIQFVVTVCNLPSPLDVFGIYTPILCYGGSTTLTALGSGGIPPYQYQFNGGGFQANNQLANAVAGIYTINIMDANGCIDTSILTISQPPPYLANVNNVVNPLCGGLCTGTAQASVAGGVPPSTYSISAPGIINANSGAISSLCNGNYTVTATDANGCTATTTLIINAPVLTVNITNIVDVTCNGNCNGSATANTIGGANPLNYSITAPGNINAATGIMTNLCIGNYTVTVTDANGCTGSASFSIIGPLMLVNVSNIVAPLCNGLCTGTANANSTGGNNPINYSISAPGLINPTSGVITGLCAGTYTVIASDANSCTGSSVFTVSTPPALSIVVSNIVDETCNAMCNGSSKSTASGGVLPYTYSISAPGVVNPVTGVNSNLCGGNYTVTVTDANGCTATSVFTIGSAAAITVTITNIIDVTCNGLCNGTSQTNAVGGNAPYTYSITAPGITNPGTGANTNLCAGSYTATVTDANGCTGTSVFAIAQAPVLSVLIANITPITCFGLCNATAQATGNGGTPPYNYTITAPATININNGAITGLCNGNYTVTITDANGCAATTNFQITQPPILAWSNTVTSNVSCNGGTNGSITVAATGGTGIISYNLQPTNQTNVSGIFTNLIVGNYTITATDVNGCTISTTLAITQPPALQITAVANTQPTCVPGNDGTITITALGGTPAYLYNIGGANQAGNIFTNVAAGNYTITVTDANGCTATSTISIAPPTSPIITSLVATNVLCNGGSTGTITATASGGLGALNYNLQPTNQNNANGLFTNLAAGVYTVTVGDANGCTISSTISILQPIALSWTQINVVNVNCNGAPDGAITVTATGGTGIISYTLQPININNNTGIFPNLMAGAYTITAMDANNCTLTIFLQITQPTALTWVTAVATNVSCNGGNDGSVTTLVSGGTGLINYNLQPTNQNNATGIFTNLVAGIYTIVATDANGCTISTTLSITEPPIIQISTAITPPTCVPGNDAAIVITASGGTPSYLYNIGGANQANNIFNNIGAGTYTITVTDMNGCTATTVFAIAAPNSPTITSAIPTDALCNPANTGTITITANGGTGIYNYSADGINFQLSNLITGLMAGTYTITVVDAIGCTATSIVVIGTTPSPIITNILVTEATCVPGCDATADITATGGNAVYTYSIDNINFQVGNTFNALCVNVYTATVVDGNGCTATSSFTIMQANPPVLTVNNTTNILCNGGNNGAISVTAVGAGVINYVLQPNGISNISGLFSNLTAFTYTIIATDANGCSASTVIPITEPSLLQFVNITNNPPLCTGANNGSVDITTIGGTGIINYTISPFANFVPPSTFNNLIGNTSYTVTAADANGCSITSSVFIVDPQPIIFTSTSSTDVTCNAASDGSITVQAIGGTGILNYSILPNPQNNLIGVFTNLNANTYTVTVTDANNCTLTTVLIINEPPPIVINTINYTDITCSNNNDGTINIACSGGTGVISYNLQPLNITNTSGIFNALIANVYTINVTDANGCSISTLVTITNPLPLIIDSVLTNNVLCNGDSNAIITTYASGGTGLLTYNLLPQNITNNTGSFNGLAAGTYTITVTDINLCSTNTIVVITEPQILTIAIANLQNLLCSGAPTGQIDLIANGGTQPYTFTLLPNNFINGTGIFTNLNAGTYTAMVVDTNGCSALIEPIVLTEPLPIKFDLLTKQDIKCFGDSTGLITVTASGGTGNIIFSLLPNIGIQNPSGSFTLLPANNYTITATDANNCTLTTTATITQNPEIIITNVLTVDLRCYGDAVGIINVAAIGGVGILTYTLNNQNPNNTGFFNNLFAGNYVVTVTDTLGCGVDSIVTIEQPDKIFLSALDIFPVYCTGYSDGKINATAGGGNGGYTYYLRPGIAINKTGYFGDLHEGTYTLTVKDSLGCTFDTILAVTPPLNPLTLILTKKDLGCYGNGTEGWAQANIIGGTPPFSYLWNSSPPQFDAVASGLKYGKYIVEVVDARGCKEKDSIVIDPGKCCEEVFIPNAFSPNGDGVNDVFRVTTATGIELKQFEVYDRWGKKVWYTNDFREGWDGTDRGALRDMNTYYYIFWYICLTDGETYMKKGDINLVR